MKKLLLLSAMILLSKFGVQAQSIQNSPKLASMSNHSDKVAATPTVVTDTLHYFYNKQVFKIANISLTGFPYYKSAAATGTLNTHMGSVFLNSDPNLVINGLSSRVAMHNSFNNPSIPIRMYLCNVNSNLLPVFPPIDSVSFSVGQAQSYTVPTGHEMGRIFGGTVNPTPHTIPGNFAVLIRNLSTFSGDTVRLFRTSSLTQTASGSNSSNNMGEGLGVIRVGGVFRKTTNYNFPTFGIGTDYEFCVAPIVTYTAEASHLTPPQVNSQPVDTVMCWDPLTFTNTSSPEFSNRMFNLVEFWRHFNPYVSTPFGGFSPDSAISWFFDDEDFDYPELRPNIVLKNGASTIQKFYDTNSCFTNCEMRARLRKMTAGGSSVVYFANIQFSVCVGVNCNGEDGTVGLAENAILNEVKVYPNPTLNSKITVSGLKGNNTLYIYDMLGQLVATQVVKDDKVLVDLIKIPEGNYILKIVDEQSRYKTVKFINQKE